MFFSILLQRLSLVDSLSVKHIGEQIADQATLDAELQTTFLGQTHTLWLGNISEALDASRKKIFFAYSAQYQGPHRILCALQEKDVPKSIAQEYIIDLDEDLSIEEKNKILSFLYPSFSFQSFQKIMNAVGKITTLDHLIVLAQYSMVLGKNTDIFIKEWLSKIIIPQSSLFTLAQYFFGKKTIQFWHTWHEIKNEYPATFWTVFWSEQLWRAYFVIVFQQQNNLIEARKMAYRLPFSFLQKDWQNIELESLKNAHTMLYNIEWRIKNSGSEEHFDLLFHTFFAHNNLKN